MKCQKPLKNSFNLYYFNLLDKKEKDLFNKHLSQCPSCKKYFREMTEKYNFLKPKKEISYNPILDQRILAAAEEKLKEQKQSPFSFSFSRLRPVLLAGFSLVILILLTFLLIIPGQKKQDMIITKNAFLNNIKIENKTVSRNSITLYVPSGSDAQVRSSRYEIHVYADTKISVNRTGKNTGSVLLMEKGKCSFAVKKGFSFTIDTFNASIRNIGTDFMLITDPEKAETRIELRKGRLAIHDKFNAKDIILQAGNSITITGKEKKVMNPEIRPVVKKAAGIQCRILLNSGKTMNGRIIGRFSDRIMVEIGKELVTITNTDIKKIEFTE